MFVGVYLSEGFMDDVDVLAAGEQHRADDVVFVPPLLVTEAGREGVQL